MNLRVKAAVAFVSAGMAAAVACLFWTTPLTMTVFFFIGLPCFGAGALLYLSLLAQFLSVSLSMVRRRSGA